MWVLDSHDDRDEILYVLAHLPDERRSALARITAGTGRVDWQAWSGGVSLDVDKQPTDTPVRRGARARLWTLGHDAWTDTGLIVAISGHGVLSWPDVEALATRLAS